MKRSTMQLKPSRFIPDSRPARPLTGLALLAVVLLLTGCPRSEQVRPSWLNLATSDALRQLAASDPRAQRDLGLSLLLEDGDAAGAREALELAGEREPMDPLTWLALGVIGIEYGQPTLGMERLGRAVEASIAARARPSWCVSPAVSPGPTPEDCLRLTHVVEEVAARLLRETDYAGRLEVIGGLLEEHVTELDYAAAYQLYRAMEHDQRVAGDAEAAAEQLTASGAVLQWRVIGPFGPFPNQSFDVEHQPERDSRLAERYDLGPGRGELETWTPQLSSSSVQLRSPLGRSGTWYAEAFLRSPAAGDVDLRLWTPRGTAVQVFIGGEEVLSRDERVRFEPGVVLGRAHFESTETTRVLVKISSQANDPGFSLGLRHVSGQILETVDPDGANGVGEARAVASEDLLQLLSPQSGEEISGLRGFVTALMARARSFWPVAEEALWRINEPSPLLLAMRATASGSTPTVPRSIQGDRLLSGMRDAFEADPGLWRARLVLVRQLTQENQGRQAVDMLREGLEEQPENAVFWHELGVISRRLGMHAAAEEAFGNALRYDGRSCGSLYQLAMMYHDEGLTDQREQTLERLGACDATARTRAQLLTDTGRAMEAFEEVLRIQAVDEYPAGLDADLADLALATGQEERAREILDRLLSRWPRADGYVGALADLDGATAGLEAARERLTKAYEQYPWEMGGLRRVAAMLGAKREVSAWRVDGREHIQRFEQAGGRYDSPSVFVLDRAVYRIFPDMSSIELVHQVTKVLTQEAIASLSEFRTPRGAEVLTLRTIKPDGTILEPLAYDADETTNLAGVEVGDYVEWEYIIQRGPSRVYPGGMQTPRFYFATSDTAMHLSELIVLIPEGVEVDFVPRGPNPPEPEPVTLAGISGFRFHAQGVASQVREPAMPSPTEVFPSVAAVAREDARSAVASWSDGLDPAMRADWRMRRLVRDLREPAQTEVELARAIYDYVLEHVQHGRGGTPATSTLATGHGDALLAYVALLRVAGFDPQIVYSWTLSADRSGPYLVPGELSGSSVRVELDDESWWITVGSRHSPFGYIPASLRGQPGLTACLEPEEVELPESPRIPDSVSNRIEGAIESDGTVAVSIVETMSGARAASFRSDVTRIPEAERAQRGAAMFGHRYAGGIAEDVSFDGVDERHEPLVVSASLRSRMLGRREGSAILLPAQLSQARRYSSLTRLSERRTPLVFDEDLNEVVEQRLTLPAGAEVTEVCPAVEQTVGRASFTVRCAVEEGTLVHRLEIHLPPQRIAPEDYAEFDAFLRAYDEAAAAESRVELQ